MIRPFQRAVRSPLTLGRIKVDSTKQGIKQMVKTYSIAMMKSQGLELVKGLPVMTLVQAEKALQLSIDAGLQGFCVVNVNAD